MRNDADEPLTIKQVTRELNVDDKTVRRWIKSGQLKAMRDIVGRYTISRADLNSFVEQRRRQFGISEE
jgi:excisionase family DNA binding protein